LTPVSSSATLPLTLAYWQSIATADQHHRVQRGQPGPADQQGHPSAIGNERNKPAARGAGQGRHAARVVPGQRRPLTRANRRGPGHVPTNSRVSTLSGQSPTASTPRCTSSGSGAPTISGFLSSYSSRDRK